MCVEDLISDMLGEEGEAESKVVAKEASFLPWAQCPRTTSVSLVRTVGGEEGVSVVGVALIKLFTYAVSIFGE